MGYPVKTAKTSLLIDPKPLRAFTQGDTHGRILTYCECLRTGAKLVAEALVNRRDIDWVVPMANREVCECDVDHLYPFRAVRGGFSFLNGSPCRYAAGGHSSGEEASFTGKWPTIPKRGDLFAYQGRASG